MASWAEYLTGDVASLTKALWNSMERCLYETTEVSPQSVRGPRRSGFADDVIVARVRGDGRRYYLNLRVATNRTAYSYRASFQTKAGQWQEIQVPVRAFQATLYGRQIPNASPVDPNSVNSIGFLLADKIPGEFSLKVDWIKVVSAEST